MKKRHGLLSALVCVLAFLMMPSVARAANTTCANADYMFPSERANYFISASSSLYWKTRVTAGRSYAVIAWAPSQDVSEGGASLGVSLFNDDTCTTGITGGNAQDYEPFVFGITGHSGDHDNVIPTTDGTLYIRVANSVAAGYTVHVLVVETTLFSPWWFVGGTNQAYVTVRNNMTGPTTARVTLYGSNGVICGTSNIALSGNGNAALEIGPIGTCATAVSGSASIAFAGTPGGLVANITTLSVPNGISFDAPFTPRFTFALPR
ncbi:MAG: hypothetical protein ABIS06_20520 [Vicinamibacterales bacterium]